MGPPNMVGRVGIGLKYWDCSGTLEVQVKGFPGGKTAAKDTRSAKSVAAAIDEVIDELAKDANAYSYLRVVEPPYDGEECGAKDAMACLQCCTYEFLPKCSAPEEKRSESAGVSLQKMQLAEFKRLFRNALKEGINELMM